MSESDAEPKDRAGEDSAPAPRARWRHRWWLVGAAVTVVAIAAVVVVAAVRTAPEDAGDEPETVVRSYLEAVRTRDVAAALRIAGDPQTTGPDIDDGFLVPEALASDWEIANLVRRYPGQEVDPVVVDVTLRTDAGIEQQGRFELSKGIEGWVIDQPFGKLSILPGSALANFDLNGVARVPPSTGNRPTTYLLFPGPYQAYSRLAGLIDQTGLDIVMLPSVSMPLLWPDLVFNQDGHRVATDAIAGYLDECVKQTVRTPPECPFGTQALDYSKVGDRHYEDDEVTSWDMITYPEVMIVALGSGIEIVERRIGVVQVTGTGKWLGEDERRTFQADCRVDLSTLTITVSNSGEFTVSGESTETTCWDGALSR